MNGKRYLNQIFIETSTDLDTLPSSSMGKLSSQWVEASVGKLSSQRVEASVGKLSSQRIETVSLHPQMFRCSPDTLCALLATDNFLFLSTLQFAKPHPRLLSFLFSLSSLSMWAWLREGVTRKRLLVRALGCFS